MKRNIWMILCVFMLMTSLLAGCGNDQNSGETQTSETQAGEGQTGSEEPEVQDEDNPDLAYFTDGEEDAEENAVTLDTSAGLTGTHHAVISVQDYGEITVELDADTAPITVTNFVKLVQEKFYDGLTFHRIMEGFMMQGGDPTGTGTGGSEETIKGEFTSNGVDNGISHVRGTISMARTSDPDSASSQFFIMHEDNDFLDGDYAAFGHVTEGMGVVDKICEDAEPTDDNGTIPAEQQPVITSIRMVD